MDELRQELAELKHKIKLYISVGRFDAAEKLLRATLDEAGPLANIHNLLGTVYHKQSKFTDALREFTAAIKINPRYVEASLNLACTLCDLSQYEEARHVFGQALEQVGKNRRQPELILGRIANQHATSGHLYLESGMAAEAIQEFRKALSLFPNMVDVKLSLAKTYANAGQPDKAVIELENLLKNSPQVIEARNHLGILYFKLGRLGEAQEQWEKVKDLRPSDLISKTYLRIVNQERSRHKKSEMV